MQSVYWVFKRFGFAREISLSIAAGLLAVGCLGSNGKSSVQSNKENIATPSSSVAYTATGTSTVISGSPSIALSWKVQLNSMNQYVSSYNIYKLTSATACTYSATNIKTSGTAVQLNYPNASSSTSNYNDVGVNSGLYNCYALVPIGLSGETITSAYTVGVTPSGGILSITPTSKAYGNITLGNSSSAQTFTITNTGLASMTNVYVGLTTATQFALSNNTCGTIGAKITVAASSTCTVDVTFTPTTAGAKADTLTVTYDNSVTAGLTQTASLSGTGLSIASVAFSPTSKNYGNMTVGFEQSSQTFTLTNSGQTSATNFFVALTTGTQFTLANNTCGTGGAKITVAAAATCTVDVIFNPSSAGAKADTITVTYDNGFATGQTQTAALSGTGVLDVTTPSIAFNSIPTTPSSSTSASYSWTASDTGGSGAGSSIASFDIALYSDAGCTTGVGGQSFTGLTAATTSKNFTGLTQGTYYAKATAYDGAGNSASTACSSVYTLDTTAPTISFSSTPTSPSNSTSVTYAWTGAADTGGSGLSSFDVALYSDSGCTTAVAGQSFTGLTSATTSKNFTGLTQGTYYAKVIAYDGVAHSTASACSGAYLLDTTAPTISFSSTPTSPSNSTSATYAWTGAADTGGSGLSSFDVALYSDSGCTSVVGGQSFTGLTAATTSKNFTGLTQGTYYAKVIAYDASGNSTASSCSSAYLLDTTAPTVAFSSTPTTPGTSTTVNFAWVGAADTGGSNLHHFDVGLYTDSSCASAVAGQTFTALSAATTSQTYTGLTSGAYFSKVTAVDGVGNSTTVCGSAFLVDTIAPTAAFSAIPTPPTTVTSGTWLWFSTIDNLGGSGIHHVDIELHTNASCTAVVGGQSFTNVLSSTRSKTFTGLTNGTTYYAKLIAYDAVGNTSAAICSSGYTVTLVNPIEISGGPVANHHCVILSTGDVKCWGSNTFGQLGLGENSNVGDSPNEMGDNITVTNMGTGRTVSSFATGYIGMHMCAILDNAQVKCWGQNTYGQLGYGNTNPMGSMPNTMGDYLPYVDLGTGRTALQVVGGLSHTCALLDNYKVKCWGLNNYGQLGYGNQVNYGSAASQMGDNLGFVDLGTGRTATSISAGNLHTCAVLDNGTTKCWGQNNTGQLGQGDTVTRGDNAGEMGNSLPAISLGTGKLASSIYSGLNHTCAILTDNTLKCWGFNNNGQLGIGDTTTRANAASQMGDSLPVTALGTGAVPLTLSLGAYETCAILVGGTTKCWGWGGYAQLGAGDTVSRGDNAGEMGDSLPVVSLGTGRTTSAIGTYQSYGFCALLDNGSVKCWGRDFSSAGLFGNGTNAQVSYGYAAGQMGDLLPSISLGTGRTATKLAVAIGSACAALDNGTVKCWGWNVDGILGKGVNSNRGDSSNEMGSSLPKVDLGTGRTAKALSQSDAHTCAILDDDSVKCWGYNYYGQLGYGDTIIRGDDSGEMGNSLPTVDLGTGLTAKKIAVGTYTSCAILNNDKVKCWGFGGHGASGNGDTVTRGDNAGEMGNSLPYVDLGTGLTAKQIIAGDYHACVILNNDKVKCWGTNNYGQLGTGGNGAGAGTSGATMGDSLAYVDLGTGLTASSLAAQAHGTCALLSNSLVKCWGNNNYGQLGQGNTTTIGWANGTMGDSLATINLGTGRTAISIGAGGEHACAILDNSTLKCWGYGYQGQLGSQGTAYLGDGAGEMGDSLNAVSLGTGRTATKVVGGNQTTCVVLDNNKVKCFGNYFFTGTGGSYSGYNYGQTSNMGDTLPYLDL